MQNDSKAVRSLAVKTASLPHNRPSAAVRRILICLMIAYGMEGLGYIVTGTYLVAYAKTVSSIPKYGFAKQDVGGYRRSALVRRLVDASLPVGKKVDPDGLNAFTSVGIALPVLIPASTAVFAGAFLFGATFMGITMLSVAFAKDLYPQNNRQTIGLLTTFFGLGQIIGPLIAGHLISNSGSYLTALLGAAFIVFLWAMSLPLGIGRAERKRFSPLI